MKSLFVFLTAIAVVFGLSACAQSRKTPTAFDGAPVAAISIFAVDAESTENYGLLYLGHSFLAFENVSDADLQVGAITLKPGEMCSVGSWGMNAHFGLWYNVESNYIDNAQLYAGRVSLTKGVSAEGMAAVNARLAKLDKWTPFTNCARVAMDTFDAAGGDTLKLGGLVTPTRLKNEIRRWTNAETDRPIVNYGAAGFHGVGGFEEYAYAA